VKDAATSDHAMLLKRESLHLKTKKVFCVVLAALILLTAFVSCSESGENKDPSSGADAGEAALQPDPGTWNSEHWYVCEVRQ
jgi:hypothetical protein